MKNEIYKCEIVAIKSYGLLVNVNKLNKVGLIHISNMGFYYIGNIERIYAIGDKIYATIVKDDPLSLSLKTGHSKFKNDKIAISNETGGGFNILRYNLKNKWSEDDQN